MTVKILRGDCRAVLRSLPDQSVHTCVTSPPYWGLRSYLPADHPDKPLEIGSEPTVEAWVQTMVEVFREVKRVLRDDGTLWVNLGDSYAGSRCGGATGATTLQGSTEHQDQAKVAKHQAFTADHKDASAGAKQAMTASRRRDDHEIPRSDLRMAGYKPKDLIGQPWMLAFALRADGWYLRQDIIWAKRSPMPESCTDRFTKAHEYVFLLSKKERYYFDHDAIQEPASEGTNPRHKTPDGWDTSAGEGAHGSFHKAGREKGKVRDVGTGVGFGHGYDAHARQRGRVKLPGNKSHAGADLYAAGDEHHRTKGGLVKYAERQRDRASAGERMGREPGWRDRTPAGWATGTEREHEELDGRFSAERALLPHDSIASRKARAKASNKSAPTSERNGIRSAVTPKAEAGAAVGYAEGKAKRMADAGVGNIVPTRNPRSVRHIDEDEYLQFLAWKEQQPVVPTVRLLSSEPFRGAHYATYPCELIRPFVIAGCPPGGTVLDPFGGSGTTGLVADQEHRNAILIDLDERNVPMATDRITRDAPLLASVEVAG